MTNDQPWKTTAPVMPSWANSHHWRPLPLSPCKQVQTHITKVVNGEPVTIWHYKLNIMHNINKDSTNHFLFIERLIEIISTNNTTVFITHRILGGKLTQDLLGKAKQLFWTSAPIQQYIDDILMLLLIFYWPAPQPHIWFSRQTSCIM